MAAVIAKGDATISINSAETEARLVFTPNPEGLGWDIDAVNKLLSEKNLSPPVNQKILEPFLAKAARSKTPMDIVIYQGIPQEDAVPESVNWEVLPIPSDFDSFRDEAIIPPPEIYRVLVNRIKKEKTVKKPGALPFLPQKEEVVVTWEKKVTREKAEVNPAIITLKYADQGKKIGTVNPPVPGKPGKNIFGQLIPVPVINSANFLFGGNIKREKNDLAAEVSGFLRIGENWADIYPLNKPSWTINTGVDGITPFLSYYPGDPRFSRPQSEEILAAAAEKGPGVSFLIKADVLDNAIDEAVKTKTHLESFPLMESREALAEVVINEEKTLAVLKLRKGTGGHNALEMKAISQALKDSHVQISNADKLRTDIQAFMAGRDLELKDYVLAEGKPSARGKDREIRLLITLLPDEKKKTLISRLRAAQGPVPGSGQGRFPPECLFGELSPDESAGFAFVEKGTEVALVQEPSGGEAGCDIFGNTLPGFPGNDPDMKLFRGFVQHGQTIQAEKDGLLLVHAGYGFFRADIIEYSDAKIKVRFSDDKMEVRVDLFRECGAGIPLTADHVLKTLSGLGIVKGIDNAALETACARAKTEDVCLDTVAARGLAPVAAGSRAVKWIADKSSRVQVKAGTLIAELSAVMENGSAGFNVMGEEIPSDQGETAEPEHDDTIQELAAGDGKQLVAVKPGELIIDGNDGNKLSIKTLLEIPGDVGPETGNIDFTGEVRVQGKVLPGFSVSGGPRVYIKGTAEGNLVSSGGDMEIAGGIRGGGKGAVRARSRIKAFFAEKTVLMAVGDIRLGKGSILSIIKTNGVFSVEAADGKLLGGSCQARCGINAAGLGSPTGGHTEISFGQDYLIKDQITETMEEISKVKSSLAGIEKKISTGIKNPEMLNRIRKEKIRLIKLQDQLKLRLFTLEEKFEEHHESEVRIRGTVYPGVVIESHGRYYEIQQARNAVIFYFDRESGRIMEKPIT